MGFKVVIVSPQKKMFEGEADSLKVPGEEGGMEILSRHAPLLATLTRGKVVVSKGSSEQSFEISKGFVEVSENSARVIIR